jgi:hypothetical protein
LWVENCSFPILVYKVYTNRIAFNSCNSAVSMPGILRKIVFLTIILFSISLKVSAPVSGSLLIMDSRPVEPYNRLIRAIGIIETRFDTLAYNPVEEAAGYFQIRPIRLEDYNRRTGNHYTMKDMFNYKISEKIFLYFADQIGPYDFEQIAKKWNGSGHMTIGYWNRIKKYL